MEMVCVVSAPVSLMVKILLSGAIDIILNLPSESSKEEVTFTSTSFSV